MLFGSNFYTNTYILLGDVMKYLKSVLWFIIPLLILSFIGSTMYYFEWLSPTIYKYIQLIIPLLSLFLGGLYLGKNSKENGWLEGLKQGSIIIFILFMISYLAFDIGFSLKGMIYYIIILLVHTLGSMIGIRNVETTK